MLDAYGLPQATRAQQEYRVTVAKDAYEASCFNRRIDADWTGLDADQRYLWLMTADALISHGLSERAAAVA